MNAHQTASSICPECGAPVPADAPQGRCLKCLFAAGAPEFDQSATEIAPAAEIGDAPDARRNPELRTSWARSFGDYELIEEIARGGMGVVYKACQVSLNRIVALKMILSGKFASKQEVLRFRVEAEAAANLRHPNIVAIYETGEHHDQHFFAMEYVAGPNLSQLVGTKPLPAMQAARYTLAIARAIHYAHTQNTLHRDLKPSNVLIDSEDQPRITDFGLTRRLRGEFGLTVTGQVLGSPNYMPPEQAGGKRGQTGPFSDVYSLGAILYYLLTARAPFQSETVEDTLLQLLNKEPVAPRLLNASVPRDLETICLKCLEKEPGRRYQSAAEVADELNRFLQDEPIRARPVSTPEKFWRWCRRKPALASLSALTGLSIVAIAIVSTVFAIRLGLSHRTEQRENYYASIALADQYIREGSIARALEILLKCPPEFRHWEWGHLLSRCHQDILSIQSQQSGTEISAAFPNAASVLSLQFSPDGQRLATQGADGRVKVWELENGRELFSSGDPTNCVLSLAFSPDAKQIALGDTNGTVTFFETRTWHKLLSIPAADQPPSPITHLAFSPDGKKLGVASANQMLAAYDALSGLVIFWITEHLAPIQRLQFSPDGRQLISQEDFLAHVWDADNGQKLSTFSVSAEEYLMMFVAPSGQRFATIDGEDKLHIWADPKTRREAGVMRGAQPRRYRRVFFSPDSRLLCVAGEQGTAKVRDVETGEELFTIPTRVYDAAFSSDGQRLVTVGAHTTAKIWDVKARRELLTLKAHSDVVDLVAFSPDGRLVATASRSGEVKLWSAHTGREVIRGTFWMWGPAHSPDGRRIALAPGPLTIWDAESGAKLSTLKSAAQFMIGSAFSPDGRRIAAAGGEKVARVWEVESGREVLALRGHAHSLLSIAFSPDGKRIATSSVDGSVKLWDAGTGRELRTLEEHRKRLTDYFKYTDLVFSGDGKRLATSAQDNAANVWDTESGRLLFRLSHESKAVSSAKFSPDGRWIATAGADKAIRLWDSSSGFNLRTWRTRAPAGWLHFSPDGKRLVAVVQDFGTYGAAEAVAEIWDVEHGRELLALRGHSEIMIHAMFSPKDGRRILTTSMDFTARQWESFPWREADYPGPESLPFAQRVRLYARNYWRERLSAEASAANGPQVATLDSISFRDGTFWPTRDPQVGPNLIDLTEHYNGVLDALIHPTPTVKDFDNDLSGLPKGVALLGDVSFDVRGLIMLRRLERMGGVWQRMWDRYPVRMDGIRIARSLRRLHVLHAAHLTSHSTALWTSEIKDGTAISSYVWHYADGSQREFDIVYGRDLRAWHKEESEQNSATDRGKVVWTGSNPVAASKGATLRLYMSTYENPQPDLEVTSIDFVSKMGPAAPFLIALTVEE